MFFRKNFLLVVAIIYSCMMFISCNNDIVENYLSYSEFGARGDGITDDFGAIIAAHEEANKLGLKIKADKNAKYYIGDSNKTAIIKTETDWGDAQFIIDDSEVDVNRDRLIFVIAPSLPHIDITNEIKNLKAKQKNVELSFEQPTILIAEDNNVKQYIRYGLNANDGSPQRDAFIVDENGKVDNNTPILLDFNNITSLLAYPIDHEVLTVRGGRFTTIANKVAGKAHYFRRGIKVTRSNTILDGITHHVQGEGEKGEGYSGFISVERTTNVLLKNSILSGHKNYRLESDPGISIGSYDFAAYLSLNLTVKNCTQATFIDDDIYWGIMASNYCKNLTYDNVKWSRFDAHQGVYNATIKNSYLRTISIIGSGKFKVENTTVNGRYFIDFRSDYGSHWDGEIFIKNCVFSPPRNLVNASRNMAIVFNVNNNGQHYFGYQTKMPQKITIDGLLIEDYILDETYKGIQLFTDFNPTHTGTEPYAYKTTETLRLRNLITSSTVPYRIPNEYLRHTMKIKDYIPPIFIIGIIASFVTVIICGYVFYRIKRKKKQTGVKP